jgi:hypothetical protein
MQNTITAYVNGSTRDANGNYSNSFTVQVECKVSSFWWQDKGLSYTASGYGFRIPTRYMVKFNGKWRRVYCRIYSNNGTLYIGKLNDVGECLIVNITN